MCITYAYESCNMYDSIAQPMARNYRYLDTWQLFNSFAVLKLSDIGDLTFVPVNFKILSNFLFKILKDSNTLTGF